MINIIKTIKSYTFIALCFVGLLTMIYIQHDRNQYLRHELGNLERVIDLEQDNVLKQRKYQDSINIATSKTIESTLNNFETSFKAITEDFEKSTGKDIKNLRSALKTQINSKEYYYIPTVDSLVKDGVIIRKFEHQDKFNTIKGLVYPDTVSLDISRRMYLTKYTYKTRNKEPWYKPWKWGKKLVTDMRSDNPKDSIVQLKEINIIK